MKVCNCSRFFCIASHRQSARSSTENRMRRATRLHRATRPPNATLPTNSREKNWAGLRGCHSRNARHSWNSGSSWRSPRDDISTPSFQLLAENKHPMLCWPGTTELISGFIGAAGLQSSKLAGPESQARQPQWKQMDGKVRHTAHMQG